MGLMGRALNRLVRAGVITALLCYVIHSVSAADKLPVPNEAALKTAQATVRDLFKNDLAAAKTAAQMTEVADKMLEAVEGKAESAANDYALLTTALGLTEKASSLSAASSIVERIAGQFAVDARDLQMQTMKNLAKGPTDKDYHKELANRALQLAAETQRADRADLTKEYLDLVDSIGRRLKTNEWAKTTSARRAEIAEHKKLTDAYAAAENTLLTKPDDPAANDATGRFLVAVKQDWERGVKMLALSNDAAIKKAAKADDAQLDVVTTATAEQATAIADAWWDAANGQTGAALKSAFKLRAGQWYSLVVADLKGLTKTKAEQRVTESGWEDDADLRLLMPLNRRDHKVAKAVRAGTGMFVPGKFVIVQTLPLAEAKELDNTLKTFKLRSIKFRPYATPKGVQVAAIWLPSSVQGDLFEGTGAEVTKHYEEMQKRGYFAQDLAGWIDENGQDRHVLLTRVGKLNEGETYTLSIHWRIAEDNPFKDLPKDAAVRNRQQYFDKSGQRFNDYIWWAPKRTRYTLSGSRSFYERKLKEVDAGLKLVDADVSTFGNKQSYAAAFLGFTGFSVTEIHGLSPEQNLVEWQKLAAQGAHPNGVSACMSNDGVVHTVSVWHTPEKK